MRCGACELPALKVYREPLHGVMGTWDFEDEIGYRGEISSRIPKVTKLLLQWCSHVFTKDCVATGQIPPMPLQNVDSNHKKGGPGDLTAIDDAGSSQFPD